MREILFRGKRLDNGEWVAGNLFILKQYKSDIDHYYILPTNTVCLFCDIFYYAVEVDPSTIGQFTGLCDKNGKKIFEGDIVVFTLCGELDSIGAVRWNTAFAGWRTAPFKGMYGLENIAGYEIIGNKWDNPELLEVEG